MPTKIKRDFFYIFEKRVVSRTYGGETYTLAVFENRGRGKIVRIGEKTACTRGHKGFDSEAWDVCWNVLTKKEREMIQAARGYQQGYYSCGYRDQLGFKLSQFGN